MELVMIDSQCL